MSLVTMWSPKHGECGNTANTMAIASLLGLEYELHTLVTQTHRIYSNLELGFLKANEAKLGNQFQHHHGLDELERLFRSRRLNLNTVMDQAVILERNRLDLLVGTSKPDDSLYQSLRDVLIPIFQIAIQKYHIVLTDIHAGTQNEMSRLLMDAAALTIINLSQNKTILDRFFQEDYEQFQQKPHLIVIGQYDPDSKYTLKNIKRHYQLRQPLYGIPYCSDYRDAQNDKDVLGWFRRNRNLSKSHPNYYFFQEVRKVIRSMLIEIGINPSLRLLIRGHNQCLLMF